MSRSLTLPPPVAARSAPPIAPPSTPAAVLPKQTASRGAARRLGSASGQVAWRLFKPSVAIAALLLLWEIAPRVGLVDEVFLPPFSTVVQAFWDMTTGGQLWENVSASLTRAVVGFAVAVAIAIPLGLAIAWYRPVSDFLSPVLELFRNTAALALLPVFILILGIGESSKIALVIYACTFPILINTISGVRTVDPLLIKSASSLGLPSYRLFQKVVLPAAVPTIFTGIRMAASSSILVLIAAEMVGAKAGLGYLITSSQFNFQIPDMYAGILAIAVLGLAVNAVLVVLERRLSRWRINT